jgi:hypothetical protein
MDARFMHAFQRVRWVTKYIFDLITWFRRTQPLIAILAAVVLVAVLCILSASCLERQIRFSGWGLQLLGVILAGVALRDTRLAFDDQPTTWQAIKRWWSGRPPFGPQHHVLQAESLMVGISGGSARARVSPGPNTPLEQRVTMLERQYAGLFDEVGTLTAETKGEIEKISAELKAERNERQQSDNALVEQLKRAVAQGIPLGRVGIICFLIGITAGTISSEIASIFGAGACQ